MFFVAKEKIGTTLGAQKEYTAAERRGIRFMSDGNVWHYLWPIELVEPSIRERFRPQPSTAVVVAPDEDAEHMHGDNVVDFGGAQQQAQAEPDHVLWSQEVGPGHVIGEPVINAFSGSSPDWVGEARRKYVEEMQQRRAQEGG